MNVLLPLQRLLWAIMATLTGERLFRFVEHSGVVVFVGPNGSGKSLLAVESLLPTLRGIAWECADLAHIHNRPVRDHVTGCDECAPIAGLACAVALALQDQHSHGTRLVYSTLPLLDHRTREPHPLYRPLVDERQLPDIEHADVLFDEVAGISDAAESSKVPVIVRLWLQQLRKRDVMLRVTSPAYDRCSLPIRQVTQVVVDCRSFFAMPSDSGRRWRPRRAMIAEAYDAFEFSKFSKDAGSRQRTEARCYYWRSAHKAMHSYDTLAQVNALSHVAEDGSCGACGGSRPRPSCGCDHSAIADVPFSQLRVVEVEGPRGGRVFKAVPTGADTVTNESGPGDATPDRPATTQLLTRGQSHGFAAHRSNT